MHEELTILIPYKNTNEQFFKTCWESVKKFGIPIVIIDDESRRDSAKFLWDTVGDYSLCTIVTMNSTTGAHGAIARGLHFVETKYVLRVDSDDELLKLPKMPSIEFDALLPRNISTNILDYLRKGGVIHGSIFTLPAMKYMYADYKYVREISNWIHEDVYAFLRLLFFRSDAIIINSGLVRKKQYKYRTYRESSTFNKVVNSTDFRMETLKLMLMHHGVNHLKFIYLDAKVRKYTPHSQLDLSVLNL